MINEKFWRFKKYRRLKKFGRFFKSLRHFFEQKNWNSNSYSSMKKSIFRKIEFILRNDHFSFDFLIVTKTLWIKGNSVKTKFSYQKVSFKVQNVDSKTHFQILMIWIYYHLHTKQSQCNSNQFPNAIDWTSFQTCLTGMCCVPCSVCSIFSFHIDCINKIEIDMLHTCVSRIINV